MEKTINSRIQLKQKSCAQLNIIMWS